MKYVLTGVTGLRNRGVEALVLPIVIGLKSIDPNAQLIVISDSPEFDTLRLKEHGVELVQFARPSRFNILKRVAKKILSRPPGQAEKLKSAIQSADMLVVTGGDVLSSDYGGLTRHLFPVELAVKSKVPVALLAHSLGPFKTSKEVNQFRAFSDKLSLVTLREQISHDYTLETLQVPKNKTHLTADVAFLLKPSDEKKVQQMRRFYNLSDDKPTVAMGISGGISRFMESDRRAHLETWKTFISKIREKYDVQILIIPHVQEANANNDDRITASHLVEELNYDPHVRVASLNHSAGEYKGLIGSCDLVISERMHACIAGLSTTTPTIAVKYSVKAEGIMKDFFGAEVPGLGVLIDFDRFLDIANAMETFDLAWNQRQEIRKKLTERLPAITALAQQNFELLKNVSTK